MYSQGEAKRSRCPVMVLRTYVYIDGFNLYRGALRDTPYRWLNLEALAQSLCGYPPHLVRYFTAHISGNPQAARRQNVYLRALQSLPTVRVHDNGTFMTHVVTRPVAPTPSKGMANVLECCPGFNAPWIPAQHPCAGQWLRASVQDIEEKGSDVNLASFLILDAAQGQSQRAIVVSGDSDLETPIRLVRDNYIPVEVVNPTPNRPSAELQGAATAYRSLAVAQLAAAQLPANVTLPTGGVSKPASWI
jgi:uncharacterized LabA/DUF88 family protein